MKVCVPKFKKRYNPTIQRQSHNFKCSFAVIFSACILFKIYISLSGLLPVQIFYHILYCSCIGLLKLPQQRITNCGLNSRNLLSQALEARSLKSRCWQDWFLLRAVKTVREDLSMPLPCFWWFFWQAIFSIAFLVDA